MLTANATEMPLVHCPLGSSVIFEWDGMPGMSDVHDVWQLYSEQAYTQCEFSSARALRRRNGGVSGRYEFQCDSVGGHWFACSVDEACNKGLQRVRVHVTDPSKTADIRARIDPVTGTNFRTLAEVMEQDLVEFSYKGHQLESNARGDEMMQRLQSVMRNSPQSCADWLVPADTTDNLCKAFLLTDMGVISRSKPMPDYAAAEDYYNQALALVPNFCLSASYLTELKLQLNDYSTAVAQFERACQACGPAAIDMEEVKLSWMTKGWTLPTNTACSSIPGGVGPMTSLPVAVPTAEPLLPPTSAPISSAPTSAAPISVSLPSPVPSGACSGSVVLAAASGMITDGPSSYSSNVECRWLIQTFAPVTLTFGSFNTEAGYDFVKVYNGPTTSAQLLLQASGGTPPAAVTTTAAGSMLVVFTSDSSVEAAGFEASYSSGDAVVVPAPAMPPPPASVPSAPSSTSPGSNMDEPCSGSQTLVASSGVFSDGRSNYSPNTACSWLIQLGSPISLSFSSFNTEVGYDFVRVYDGATSSSPRLVELSGASTPPSVLATSGTMYVEFAADSSVEAAGFVAAYSVQGNTPAALPTPEMPSPATPVVPVPVSNPSASQPDSGCTVLTQATGSITDGPFSYDNSVDMCWLINTPNGSPITLSFSSFNTEAGYDFVRVYNGATSSSVQLLEHSGSDTPPSVVATSGAMYVVLSTDSSVAASGFVASYDARGGALAAPPISAMLPASPVSPSAPVPAANPVPVNSDGCTVLSDASGSLSDGPGNYADNTDLCWLISTGAGVSLSFSSFSTEAGYDFVWLYDGASTNSPELLRASGGSLPAVTSSSGVMLVKLTSDSSVAAAGFSATYSLTGNTVSATPMGSMPEPPPVNSMPAPSTVSSTGPCDGSVMLSQASGTISDGPASYQTNSACTWLINSGSPITLSFSEFATEAGYDFVNVYDGNSASAPLLLSASGSSMPSPVSSTGSMFVSFTSDSSVETTGFIATYSVM